MYTDISHVQVWFRFAFIHLSAQREEFWEINTREMNKNICQGARGCLKKPWSTFNCTKASNAFSHIDEFPVSHGLK